MGTYRNYQLKAALFKADCTYDTIDLTVAYEPSFELTLPEDNKAVLIDSSDDSFTQKKLDPVSR